MEVILLKDVEGTGYEGELVKVKPGFANNFLIRQGFARLADKQAVAEFNSRKASELFREESMRGDAEKTAANINEKTINITANAGSTGRLFGSVTRTDIASAIKEQLGADIDKRKIATEGDIKTHGTFTVVASVITGVTATIYVAVSGDVEKTGDDKVEEKATKVVVEAKKEVIEEVAADAE